MRRECESRDACSACRVVSEFWVAPVGSVVCVHRSREIEYSGVPDSFTANVAAVPSAWNLTPMVVGVPPRRAFPNLRTPLGRTPRYGRRLTAIFTGPCRGLRGGMETCSAVDVVTTFVVDETVVVLVKESPVIGASTVVGSSNWYTS